MKILSPWIRSLSCYERKEIDSEDICFSIKFYEGHGMYWHVLRGKAMTFSSSSLNKTKDDADNFLLGKGYILLNEEQWEKFKILV